MKKRVEKKNDAEMRQDYPISDRLPGWFFRVTEVSAGAYLVEGSDSYGRTVSRNGSRPEELLARCVEDARAIQGKIV